MSLYENLYEKNKGAVDFALEVKTAGILAQQRVGKTWITGGVIEALAEEGFRALIVSPKTNKFTTWVKFIEEQLPQCELYQGFDEWKEFKDNKRGGPIRVYLIHWEELNKGRMIHWLKKYPWTLIAIDESQRAKNKGSVGSRRIRQLRYSAEYKLILSGTPIDKKPLELWGQMRFLNPDVFGDRWADFEDDYLRSTGFEGRDFKFRRGMEEKFIEEIAPWVIRIDAKEAGIKQANIIPVRFSLLGEQRMVYNTYEQDLVVRYGELELITDLKITHQGKLEQMTGGYVKDGDGIVHPVGKAKERKLISLMSRHSPPMVIFCRYTHELHGLKSRIEREFEYPRVELLHGKIKDTNREAKRTNLLTEFMEGLIDVLLCQVKTGGVGIDLYIADTSFLYSVGHSFIDFDQILARLTHKEKETAPTTYILIAKNTVDEDIYSSIQSKTSTSVEFWKRIKRRKKKCPSKTEVSQKRNLSRNLRRKKRPLRRRKSRRSSTE